MPHNYMQRQDGDCVLWRLGASGFDQLLVCVKPMAYWDSRRYHSGPTVCLSGCVPGAHGIHGAAGVHGVVGALSLSSLQPDGAT
jgi:hypothetical protein